MVSNKVIRVAGTEVVVIIMSSKAVESPYVEGLEKSAD